jgi:prophage endopeptidase
MIPLTGHNGCLILCAAAVALSGVAGWTLNGWRMSGQVERLNATHATAMAVAERSRTQAEAKYRQAEREAADRIASVYDAYREVERNAETEINNLRADIESGRQRLSVAARCPSGGQMPGAADDTGRADAQARADIDPEAAARIVAITDDGDAAIRQLNALIDVCAPPTPHQSEFLPR